MDGPEVLRRELTTSIQRTLVAEARTNELAIAWVRVATVVGMLGVEAWLVLGGSKLGDLIVPGIALTLAMFLWSLGLAVALHRGAWSAAVPWVVPFVDYVYFTVRQGLALFAVGPAHFRDVQDLTTVAVFAGVLILTGAFRLSERAVLFTSTLAIALYVSFATQIGLGVFFVSVHLLLLGAVGMAATGLTRIVQRGVHGEVTRLTLARLLPASVLEAADSDPLALLSEPRSVEATVVVTDLRGFTRWAEHRTPIEVLAHLNTVQGTLADIVLRHGGTVDKFMGDGMLAVFGAPEPLAEHASAALAAVREMLAETARLPEVQLGVGVHSGELVLGCLGSGLRMEFTVLGDTVNTASRLESATKEQQVRSLVSASTVSRSGEAGLRRVGEVALRGRDRVLEVFTLDP
ncbi:MAG: adenylate/guanylate cyclase domain-containing protein [Myxococcota bacterium]